MMATSISKAQAKALASGFLDTIGASRSGFKAVESTRELIILAAGLVTEAQSNLNKADRVATGALSESLKVLNPEIHGGVVQVDVEALSYYKFVDAGVAGTRSGSSAKGYKFKNKMPPVDIIRKWVVREGLKAKTNVGGKPITNRESRRKSISFEAKKQSQMAFGIAKSIQLHGLKRTNFFSKAVASTKRKSREAFGKAFKLDIINSIPTKLNQA